MELNLYYAVSNQGVGWLFEDEPERNEHFGNWVGTTSGGLHQLKTYLEDNGFEFPRLSFQDDPVPIKITVSL